MARHLTLKVSHEDAISLLTVTFMPPPLSAHKYFCSVIDLNCTSVPSYIAIPNNGSAKPLMKNSDYIQESYKQQNLEKTLTSTSPLGMPSNSEGLIQPSTTSHPPKFTPLTLESPRNPSTSDQNTMQENHSQFGRTFIY